MPMYLVTHTWPDEEALKATKEAADFFERLSALPDGIEFLASYNFDVGCYTLWKAPNKEVLEKLMEGSPTFKKNAEIVEVVQSYPPTVEYIVRTWRMVLSAAKR